MNNEGTGARDARNLAPKRTGRRATMSDVAARVGVSRQLVGLVFRNEAGVGADTRDRILAAARHLGYSPNTAAQSLRGSSTRSIGVIFNPYELTPLDILSRIYEHAAAAGYRVLVSTTTQTRTEQAAIDELVGYRCEALILIAPRAGFDELRRVIGPTPVVVVGRGMPGSDFDVVRSRGAEGMDSMVRYLAGLGHRSICYVHCLDLLDAEVRLGGYRRAMAELGLEQRVIELPDDFTEEAGARVAGMLLQGGELPGAVMCNNDLAASGLSHGLLRAGIRCPQDISITGYDDNRIAGLTYLDLTTVCQDPNEMAQNAVEAAVARAAGIAGPPREIFTSARLVIRSSTAAPTV